MKLFVTAIHHRELLHNLVVRNLKSRYKDSALGFLWSVLTPLFMALIYVVFLRILARGVPMEEVLIGVFAWQFTAQCVGNGLTCITDSGNLVKKVYFPRIILPMSVTISNLVNFLLTLIVQFILVGMLLIFHHQWFSVWTLLLPLLIVAHTLFCFTLVVLLSCINVYFRDIQHLVNVSMTAWFFLTPAMYSLQLVHDMAQRYQASWLIDVYMLNPMAVLITGYRALILARDPFLWSWAVGLACLLSVLLFFGSLLLFERLQKNFSDML